MVVAVTAPSSEASLLKIEESRSLATISPSVSLSSVSSISTWSSCGGGGSEECERVLFFSKSRRLLVDCLLLWSHACRYGRVDMQRCDFYDFLITTDTEVVVVCV